MLCAARRQDAEVQLRSQLQRRAQEVRAAQERFADYRAAKARQVAHLEARLRSAIQLVEPCCPSCGANNSESRGAGVEEKRRDVRSTVCEDASPASTPREAKAGGEESAAVSEGESSGEAIAAAEGEALNQRLADAAQHAAEERRAAKEIRSLQVRI